MVKPRYNKAFQPTVLALLARPTAEGFKKASPQHIGKRPQSIHS